MRWPTNQTWMGLGSRTCPNNQPAFLCKKHPIFEVSMNFHKSISLCSNDFYCWLKVLGWRLEPEKETHPQFKHVSFREKSNKHGTWKSTLGKGRSSSMVLHFLGSILIFWNAHTWNLKWPLIWLEKTFCWRIQSREYMYIYIHTWICDMWILELSSDQDTCYLLYLGDQTLPT